ncbi:MAG: hypothetical protein V4664_00810 [Patescibacteria group bacterium]
MPQETVVKKKTALIVEANNRPQIETFAHLIKASGLYADTFDFTVVHTYVEAERLLQPKIDVDEAHRRSQKLELRPGHSAKIETTRRGLRLVIRDGKSVPLDYRAKENLWAALLSHEIETMSFVRPYDLVITDEEVAITHGLKSPRLRALGLAICTLAQMAMVSKIGIIESSNYKHHLADIVKFRDLIVRAFNASEWPHVSNSLTGISFPVSQLVKD